MEVTYFLMNERGKKTLFMLNCGGEAILIDVITDR